MVPKNLLDQTEVRFGNEDISSVYQRMRLNAVSIEDALTDLQQDGSITILYADFANGYPFLTPRDTEILSPLNNTHDYLCAKTYENAGRYSSNVSRLQIVDHPLYYIELFDQLEHRKDYLRSIVEAKTNDDMYAAILNEARQIPRSKEAREEIINKRIQQASGSPLASRLRKYSDRVASGAIKSIFECIDAEMYFRSFSDQEKFDSFMSEIDKFRGKPSNRDTVDAEMHKLIDVLMIVSTISLHQGNNKYKLRYWGQEKLSRIFGSHSRRFARNALSPRIIQQSFLEVPYDRYLSAEATYNLKRRVHDLRSIIDDLYIMRQNRTIPLTLAEACAKAEKDFSFLLFGRNEIVQPKEYDKIMENVALNAKTIKEVFETAISDNASASDIVKNLASSTINKDAIEALKLRPNDRINNLLNSLSK